MKGKSLSRVRLLVTPWTAVHQAPPSMGFSRQEYWSGVPLPSPSPILVSHFQCVGVLACIFHCIHFSLHAQTARSWNTPDPGLCHLLHGESCTPSMYRVSQLHSTTVLPEYPVLPSFTGSVHVLMISFAKCIKYL